MIKKIITLWFIGITSLFWINNVFAGEWINYLDSYTKIDRASYSYTWTLDLTHTNDKVWYRALAVDQSNKNVYTLDSTGKNILVYTNWVLTKTINFISSGSPVFNDVKMVYQPTTKNLYLFWVSWVWTYEFPTNSTISIENTNKALFIITYSTIQNKVIDTFSIWAGDGNITNSFNIDDLNNIFINSGIDDGAGSSEWNITIIDKDWVINSSAVFSWTTMITSSQNIDWVNWIIAWKMSNWSSFIQKVELSTMNWIWFALELDNATISDIFYNSINNKTYALVSFTGSKQINWISYTNTTWTDSLVLVLDETFSTIRSFQLAWDGEINLKRFVEVEDNEIILYWDYTNSLTNPTIDNRGWKDWLMIKLKNWTTETDFVWIATFNKAWDNVITDLQTNGWTYYYALIDNKIFELWNNSVYQDVWICWVWKKAVWDTVNIDITTWKYDYWTTNQLSNSSNSEVDDYSVLSALSAWTDHTTYYHIVNIAYIVDWDKYSNWIASKNTTTIGWSTNWATFPNNFWTLYKSDLQDTLYKAIMNWTPLNGNNWLSYNDFYKYKGIHPAMLFNQHPYNNVDFDDSVSLTTSTEKRDLLQNKFILWRNFQSNWSFVDEINASLSKSTKNVITRNELTSNINSLWYSSNYHYPLIPIKDNWWVSKAYLQYSCWNLICEWTECFGWIPEKSECWNGKIDWVEVCDGLLYKDTAKVSTYRWLWYDISCSATCNVKIANWTNSPSSYTTKVLRCVSNPETKKDLECWDNIHQTKAEKDAFILANPWTTSDNINEQCDWELWCDPKTCTFPIYDTKCWDGVIQSKFEKQELKKNDNTHETDMIDEKCDDWINGSATCNRSCEKILHGIELPPVFWWACGDYSINQPTEQCDDWKLWSAQCTSECKNVDIDTKIFCWNNKIDTILKETCDWDDRNPIWYNPLAWETCNQCIKWIPPSDPDPDPSLLLCWNGLIWKRADWKNETCDLWTAIEADWINAWCWYPTIPDPSSSAWETLANPNWCFKAVCWNWIKENTEICDQWDNNWTWIFKDWYSCNETCSINTPENALCWNGKIDVVETPILWLIKTTVEQCDNWWKNDWLTAVNWLTCNAKCEVVLPCNTVWKSTAWLNTKYNFIYTKPLTDKNVFEIWSYDLKTEKFSKKDAILPDTAEFAKFYGSNEVSTYTNTQLALGKTILESWIETLNKADILRRYNWNFLNLSKRLQLLTDDSKSFASLSFSLSEINQRSATLRKFLFKQWMQSIEPYKFEISTNSCSTNEPETQWEVNIIWVINWDTDSLYLVKNFWDYIPLNPYKNYNK